MRQSKWFSFGIFPEYSSPFSHFSPLTCHTSLIHSSFQYALEITRIIIKFMAFIKAFFLKKIFIVIQLQLYVPSPHPSTPPQRNTHPSPTSTLPLDFVLVSFVVVPVIPYPHCPLPTLPWLFALWCVELS